MLTCPKQTRGRKAFTLIELLIVIAIILILIAIALPNFLDAQARAKVTREQSDIRALATAIESMRLDFHVLLVDFWDDDSAGIIANRFTGVPAFFVDGPPTFAACCYWHRGDGRGGTTGIFTPLTTPVAYMTSVPVDPFKFEGDDLIDPDREEPISYQYIDNEAADTRIDNGDPLKPLGVFGCYRPLPNGAPSCPGFKLLGPDQYVLIGFGPDLERDTAYDVPYAPTNGTKSAGDVLYRSDLGAL